jgi:TldD protein
MVANQQEFLQAQRETTCGVGIQQNTPNCRSYQWCPLATNTSLSVPSHLPTEIHEMASKLHYLRMDEHFDQAVVASTFQSLLEKVQKEGIRVELSLHACDQRVAINDASAWMRDHRCYATVGVRVFIRSSDREKSISRSYSYASLDDLLTQLPDLIHPIDSLATIAAATLDTVPCPEDTMPVVLAPGHAAVFFHEICGHPLEGDIVISNTSYLASWIGRRVAEEWMTLVDDPAPGSSKISHHIDDEGTPSRPAYLIKQGVLQEPLLDKRSASILKLEPNGHGRRLDFRHYAVPRMSHTQVVPHAGTAHEAYAGIKHGIMIYSLKLRHMNIASGDFSFAITEARLIKDGRLGSYISPGLLHGNGLQALREIDFVGADDVRFLNAGAGCGKLDQWPLVVSFGQPTVRFRQLRVQPW